MFGDEATRDDHLCLPGDKNPAPNECPACATVYCDEETLAAHSCECKSCGKLFASRQLYTRHSVECQGVATADSTLRNECSTCKTVFPSQAGLAKHACTGPHPLTDEVAAAIAAAAADGAAEAAAVQQPPPPPPPSKKSSRNAPSANNNNNDVVVPLKVAKEHAAAMDQRRLERQVPELKKQKDEISQAEKMAQEKSKQVEEQRKALAVQQKRAAQAAQAAQLAKAAATQLAQTKKAAQRRSAAEADEDPDRPPTPPPPPPRRFKYNAAESKTQKQSLENKTQKQTQNVRQHMIADKERRNHSTLQSAVDVLQDKQTDIQSRQMELAALAELRKQKNIRPFSKAVPDEDVVELREQLAGIDPPLPASADHSHIVKQAHDEVVGVLGLAESRNVSAIQEKIAQLKRDLETAQAAMSKLECEMDLNGAKPANNKSLAASSRQLQLAMLKESAELQATVTEYEASILERQLASD